MVTSLYNNNDNNVNDNDNNNSGWSLVTGFF